VAVNGNGSAVWKWLVAFLGGLILALFPALWALNQAPSAQQITELQQQLESTQVELARVQERQDALLALVERHLNETP
jgi:hypothetical protein